MYIKQKKWKKLKIDQHVDIINTISSDTNEKS